MLAQTIRASRSSIARITRPQFFSKRSLISPTAIRQADLVQELYLKELKSYKPTPVKPSDAEGHVQKFTLPKVPPSPEETNIANELKAYEASAVEVEGQANSEGGATPIEEDWLEDELEDEDNHGKGH